MAARERKNSWEIIRQQQRDACLLYVENSDCRSVCPCAPLPCPHFLVTCLCKGITYICFPNRCHYLSVMPPSLAKIHTHPTLQTAICPVINLTDTLCNIDCLTARHLILVCVFACVCVCVSCVFVHLSCLPVYLCLPQILRSGSDPNECVC